MFLTGIWTFLACASYSADDPSFLQATAKLADNIGGYYGAAYADLILQTLGYGGFLISALLAIWSVKLFREGEKATLLPRIMFAPPAICLFAAVLSVWFSLTPGPAETSAGGHLGKALGMGVIYGLSKIGLDYYLWGAFLLSFLAVGGVIYVAGVASLDFSFLKSESDSSDAKDKKTGAVLTGLGRLLRDKKPGLFLTGDFKKDESDHKETFKEKVKAARAAIKDTVTGGAKETEKPAPRKKAPKEPSFEIDDNKEYEFPSADLLQEPPRRKRDSGLSEEVIAHNAQLLESVLEDFNVRGEIKSWRPGPVVTLYELEPAPGVRSSRVIGLADDIARAMSAISARVAVVPGKNAIGVELPNARRETVYFREVIDNEAYGASNKELPLGLGKDIAGDTIVADLAKMPHLLIAGTTGSGKSVGINTMILSLLYKLSPKQCKMIMIDPKMLELSVYDGIPHLLTPVVINPKKAVLALKWVVREMEERYDMMSKTGVRKLSAFNKRIEEAKERGEVITRKRARGFDPATGQPVEEEEEIPLEPLPYIVVVVDEMADLMMVAGKEIEGAIQRLAQMARAAGIHLIMATQRPSVDVITGTIKANFPTRISFQVTSKIDSRTILGEQGAEQLLGQGDMLFMESGGKIRRVHGAFVADDEVENIVAALKLQGKPEYVDSVTADPEEDAQTGVDADPDADPVFTEAVEIVRRDGKASTSYIQRKLKIGYNRAARLMEEMEEKGIISPADHTGKREILAA